MARIEYYDQSRFEEGDAMDAETSEAKVLELEDIQASVLRLRPFPYNALVGAWSS